MSYLLFRFPVLMEDEGRTHFIGARETKEEIEELLETQIGYFHRGDFEIIRSSSQRSDS